MGSEMCIRDRATPISDANFVAWVWIVKPLKPILVFCTVAKAAATAAATAAAAAVRVHVISCSFDLSRTQPAMYWSR